MANYIKYNPDFILSFKNLSNLDNNLVNLFQNINSLFESSPDFKGKKIILPSTNKVISNKWKNNKNDSVNDTLKKKINAILNKLTNDNFDVLITKMESINITSYDMLDIVVNAIYSKFVTDHFFHIMYGKLINVMSNKSWFFNKDNNLYNFRQLIISKCHNEFNKLINNIESHKSIQFGNIILLGELYNNNIISHSVIQNCINFLLINHTNNNVDLLCKLLSTISENTKHSFFDNYFNILIHLQQKSNLDSRIKFLILDLLDARNNQWTSKNNKLIANTDLSTDELKQKMTNIYDEYIEFNNLNDIKAYLNDIPNNQTNLSIKLLIESSYDISNKYYSSFYNLLLFILKQKNIHNIDSIIIQLFDSLPDLYIDIPNASVFISNLIIFLNNNNLINYNNIYNQIDSISDIEPFDYILENIE